MPFKVAILILVLLGISIEIKLPAHLDITGNYNVSSQMGDAYNLLGTWVSLTNDTLTITYCNTRKCDVEISNERISISVKSGRFLVNQCHPLSYNDCGKQYNEQEFESNLSKIRYFNSQVMADGSTRLSLQDASRSMKFQFVK